MAKSQTESVLDNSQVSESLSYLLSQVHREKMYKQSAGLIGILKGMSAANSDEQSHKPSPDNSTEAVPSTEGKIQETLILADRQIGQKLTKDGVQPHPSSSHEAGCSKVKSPVTKDSVA